MYLTVGSPGMVFEICGELIRGEITAAVFCSHSAGLLAKR
jgi:hypothetical protein